MEEDSDSEELVHNIKSVKCRLCISENGNYQISPMFQKQILYCFDINVDENDSLPQVICRNCKLKLKDYFETKKEFNANQQILLSLQLSKKVNEAQSTEFKYEVPLEQEPVKETTSNECDNAKKNARKPSRKRRRIVSTSSESETEQTWESLYVKKFTCHYCTFQFRTKQSLFRHIKVDHSKLTNQQEDCIRRHCTVTLNKCDMKPNLTGFDKFVVLRPDNIIGDYGSLKYHLEYIPIASESSRSSRRMTYENVDSDSSSSYMQRKRRKCNRNSSSDTLVIDDRDNPSEKYDDENDIQETKSTVEKTQVQSNEVQCINLDDSSNDSPEKANATPAIDESALKEEQIITNIISMCYNKYTGSTGKVVNVNFDSTLDTLLNKKLLSIGRKVMSLQGISSPGLLKYLEHKMLTVHWSPVSQNTLQVTKTNYVRIMTRLMTKPKDDGQVHGWQVHKPNEFLFDAVPEPETWYQPPPEPQIENCPANNVIDGSNLNHFSRQFAQLSDVTIELKPDVFSENKLLNSNPVSNPKKLPKKGIATNQVKQTNENDMPAISLDSDDEMVEEPVSDMQLPIITSTQSLAPVVEKEASAEGEREAQKPRIKCKPVSELLAQPLVGTLPNGNAPVATFAAIATPLAGTGFTLLPVGPQLENSSNQIQLVVAPTTTTTNNEVLIDSVVLPNMATSSPILYFKNLLHMYGITLVTMPNSAVPEPHKRLVNFKFSIKNQGQTIMLRITLFVHNNAFYLKLKRNESDEMHIDGMSPFWQMEMLKSLREDAVSKKIVHNANTEDLRERATKFVNLLNIIDLQTKH